jgi:hypothetical protein
VRDAVEQDRLRAVWEIELDRLELDVIRAERLLKGLDSLPTDPWSPPIIPGQIPVDLAARAQELLDRQDRVTADLGRALAAAQTQVAYADRAQRLVGRDPSVPVYLDLEA